MSLAAARRFLAERAPDLAVLEMADSTATVALAAAALGVAPAQIAKTLTLRTGAGAPFLLVARGDARLDNGKARRAFGGKVSMLPGAEVEAATGHPVGGVCPFGLAEPLRVFCDVRLRDFAEVLPAAGSPNSAVRLAPERLALLCDAEWVDVCRDPEAVAEG